MSRRFLLNLFCLCLALLFVAPAPAAAAPETAQQSPVAELSGVYRVRGGFISVGPFDFGEGSDRFSFLDFRDGRFGFLKPSADGSYVSGPGLLVDEPVEVRIRFQRDRAGRVTGLSYERGGKAEQARKADLYREEEVRFSSGGAELAGTLRTPRAGRRHGAVVIVHGSGPLRRNFFGPLQHFFLEQGLAVLSFDKRGTGASTGGGPASIEQYAADVLAGVALLKGRKDIRRDSIGLWGASQGGWVIAAAAARSPDVAFAILHAGPAVSPARNDLLNAKHVLRADGFSEAEIADAARLMDMKIRYARSGEGWDALQKAAEAGKGKGWWRYVNTPATQDSPSWASRRAIQDYDPLPDLRRIKVPVLAFFGDRDTEAPMEENAPLMREALAPGASRGSRVVVLNGVNHLFMHGVGGKKELPKLNRFETRYFETLAAWLKPWRK